MDRSYSAPTKIKGLAPSSETRESKGSTMFGTMIILALFFTIITVYAIWIMLRAFAADYYPTWWLNDSDFDRMLIVFYRNSLFLISSTITFLIIRGTVYLVWGM